MDLGGRGDAFKEDCIGGHGAGVCIAFAMPLQWSGPEAKEGSKS